MGSAAILIAEESVAARLGLKPRAAITHFAPMGDDLILMFASVVLAWPRKTGADPERVNRLGGAIALGHPVGASGGRLLANLIATLEESGGRFGLQTMCESGGMANATLIERL
jgi:acetyl-CoA acyltransferase